MKKKITIRQFILLFVMSNFAPSIRIFASLLSKDAGRAAWLVPIAAGGFFIALLFILYALVKQDKYTNLSELFLNIFGKTISKILMSVYLIWIVVLAAMYTRYYAEHLLASIIRDSSMEFLIIILLVPVYFAIKGGIKALARMSEFIFPIFMIILLAMFVLLFTNVDIQNLYPITVRDVKPIFGSTYIVLAVWGYFTLNLFFAHEVDGISRIKKHSLPTTLIVVVTASLMLISVIGILGASLTARATLPFFIAVKSISALGPLTRLEPVVMSIWIVTDFLFIALLSYTGLSLSKQVFNIPEKKHLGSPFVIIIFILTLFFARNAFKLDSFSKNIILPVNLILCYAIPIILLVVGKLRKKIGSVK